MITWVGEEEAGLCASRAICFIVLHVLAFVLVCPFTLPLDVVGSLRFVIVALPGLFYLLFYTLLSVFFF